MIKKIKKKIKGRPYPVIALLTDFKSDSPYTGMMKGVITKIAPRAGIIDLCHNIRPGDIAEAGFILKSSYSFFPDKTIFCVVVDPGVGTCRKPILIRTAHYYFIGPDNGVLSMAAYSDGVREMIELTNKDFFLKDISSTFQGRDVFAPAGAYLAKGCSLKLFGKSLPHIKKTGLPKVIQDKRTLKGIILYTDSFGNLITNIDSETFNRFPGKNGFMAVLKRKKISCLCLNYSSAENKTPFFIKGSFGYMEISLKNDNAAHFFKAEKGDQVIIKKARR